MRDDVERCRLFATYGVTEACVYQTMGEVLQLTRNHETTLKGQNVGKPLPIMSVRICQASNQEELVDAISLAGDGNPIGEVVLQGELLDELSCYFQPPCHLSSRHDVLRRCLCGPVCLPEYAVAHNLSECIL